MIPGSAQFAGMSEAQRNAIVQALLAQQGAPAPAEVLNPYQDIVDPSDPASYDSTLGEVVAGFPSPTVTLNPADIINPDKSLDPSTLEAETPAQQEMDVLGPPEVNPNDNLEAPSPNAQIATAFNSAHAQMAHNTALNDTVQAALNDAITANITGPDAETTGGPFGTGYGFGSIQDANNAVQAALDSAIAASITGTAAQGMQAVANEASNTAVSSALADAIAASPASDTATGGFGTGTGFSSADAANDAVGAALGAAIDAASGYDSSGGFSGEAGTGEGGGSSGGDGGK